MSPGEEKVSPFGLGITLHALPLKCSIKVVPDGVALTAIQNIVDVQEIPNRLPSDAGTATGFHLRPLKCSINGWLSGGTGANPVPFSLTSSLLLQAPAAKQLDTEAHETEESTSSTAPGTRAMGSNFHVREACPWMLECASSGATEIVSKIDKDVRTTKISRCPLDFDVTSLTLGSPPPESFPKPFVPRLPPAHPPNA
jgi:hypothetical protein